MHCINVTHVIELPGKSVSHVSHVAMLAMLAMLTRTVEQGKKNM